MPYGIPLTEQERIDKHMLLYGEMPPETRLGIPQGVSALETNENMNVILLAAGVGGTWIFFEFILPHLMNK